MVVDNGILDDVEEDLKVDVGVTLIEGVDLLGPGSLSAICIFDDCYAPEGRSI